LCYKQTRDLVIIGVLTKEHIWKAYNTDLAARHVLCHHALKKDVMNRSRRHTTQTWLLSMSFITVCQKEILMNRSQRCIGKVTLKRHTKAGNEQVQKVHNTDLAAEHVLHHHGMKRDFNELISKVHRHGACFFGVRDE
jgi:hypothetical protein